MKNEPHHLASFVPRTREPLVDADKAATFLHMALRSLKQLAREGRIPAHPRGDVQRDAGCSCSGTTSESRETGSCPSRLTETTKRLHEALDQRDG
jgi:hypothetical protein